MLLRRLALLALLLPAAAFAQRATTQDALSRMQETLALRMGDGVLSPKDLTPALVVSVAPAYEETRAWYPAAALNALVRVFGAAGLRSCEACMSPRLYVEQGRMEQDLTSLTVPEIVRLDEQTRGTAAPARSAIWLDETPQGVALRIVDLRNSRIVFAQNFDPRLYELTRTHREFTLTEELERRARGDSLTHTFVDAAVYPGQHFSLDFVEQWGDSNHNLSGLTLSLWDPVMGVGAAYYRVVPQALNITVGGQVILSVPTALVSGVNGQVTNVIDPLLTGVFVARLPIADSNYGLLFTASTQGRIGFGISLMNVSLLPVLP